MNLLAQAIVISGLFILSSCAEEGGGDAKPKKSSTAASSPTSSTSSPTSSTDTVVEGSGTNAVPISQTVEAIDDIDILEPEEATDSDTATTEEITAEETTAEETPSEETPSEETPSPELSWDLAPATASALSGQASSATFSAILLNSSASISYAVDSSDSCVGQYLASPAIDSSGVLSFTGDSELEGSCTVSVSASAEGLTIIHELSIDFSSSLSFGESSFTAAEDSPIAGVVISATSVMDGASVTYSLDSDLTGCLSHPFSVPFAFDAASGAVSGTPSVDGSCTFTVAASDGFSLKTQTFTLNVDPTDDPIVYVSGPSTLNLAVNSAFSETYVFTDEDGTPDYQLNLDGMTCDEESWITPLTINSSGELSGRPSFVGSCSVQIGVTSGIQSISYDVAVTTTDTSAPSTPGPFVMTSPSSSPSTETNPVFSVTVSETSGTIHLYHGSSCENHVESFPVGESVELISVTSALSDGSYSFGVSHEDLHGNESACSIQKISLIIDNEAPLPPASASVAGWTSSDLGAELSYGASPSTDISEYQIRLEDDLGNVIFDWQSNAKLTTSG